MNRIYSFAISLQDLVSGPLARISQNYTSQMAKWERLSSQFKTAFASAGQSVDQLRKKLDGLKAKRDILVDTRQIKAANREIEGLEKRLNKLQTIGTRGTSSTGGNSGGWLAGLARGALPYLGAAGLMAGAGSLATSGMSAEQTKLAYSQFAGNQAGPLYERLNKFANDTSFSNDEILKGGRTLLAAGYNADAIEPLMRTIGNISAGAGKNYGDMIGAVAKIKQKGFVDGGELHQEFGGTPLMETLQKNLGINGEQLFKMAEKHQIRYEDLAKAMITMTTGKGIFTGYLEKDMATAKGKLSTFLGNLEYKFQQWGETQNGNLAKLFDFGTEFINKMGPIEEAVGKLFQAFAPLGESLKGILITFGLIPESGSAVEGVIRAIAGVVNVLATAVKFVASPWGQLLLLFAGMVKAAFMVHAALFVVNAEGVIPLIATLQKLWVVIASNPIGIAVIAIVGLVTLFKTAYENVEWFRDGVDRMAQTVKNVFSNIAPILVALVSPTWENLKAAGAVIGKAWSDAGQTVEQNKQYQKYLDKRGRAESERDDAGGVYKPQKPKFAGLSGSTSGGSVGDKAGLSATTGGTKSTSITINLKSLNEGGIHINASGIQDGLQNMEDQLIDSLLRILNSANALATN